MNGCDSAWWSTFTKKTSCMFHHILLLNYSSYTFHTQTYARFISGALTSVSWKMNIVPPWYFFFFCLSLTPSCIFKKSIKEVCVLCKEKKWTGITYCGGRSSPGSHPLPRQTLSSGRSPRSYSTAVWDPWSSQEESRCCRRLQVWKEVLWFLPWPSPPFFPLPGDRFVSFLSRPEQEPHWGLPPPTNCCLFPSPLLHRVELILLNLRGQFPWTTLFQGSKCPLSPEVNS